MSLIKIISIIVLIWLIQKVIRFIYDIHVITRKSKENQKKKNWKDGIDIQEADYEDVK